MKNMFLLTVCVAVSAFSAVFGLDCSTGDGYIAKLDDKTCMNFIYCEGGRAFVQGCPDGYIFHPEMKQCVMKDIYDCGAVFGQDCSTGDGNIANLDDKTCMNFTYCEGGKAFDQRCPDGYIFHPEMKQCVMNGSYDCGAVFGLDCSTGDGNIAKFDDKTCMNFTYCEGGKSYDQRCPDGYIFHPKMKQCVMNDSYDCVCEYPCVRPICPSKKDVNIPDTTNCGRFYYCTGGIALRRYCDPGLTYVPALKECRVVDTWSCPQVNNAYPVVTTPPVDPNTQQCMDLVQRYAFYSNDVTATRVDCQLTCTASQRSHDPAYSGDGSLNSGHTTGSNVTLTATMDDLASCGPEESGNVCFRGSCVQLAKDYQNECDLNSGLNGSVAVMGNPCQVQCVSRSNDDNAMSTYVRTPVKVSVYNITMVDRTPCNTDKGSWLCSAGNCLKAEHFPMASCSK